MAELNSIITQPGNVFMTHSEESGFQAKLRVPSRSSIFEQRQLPDREMVFNNAMTVPQAILSLINRWIEQLGGYPRVELVNDAAADLKKVKSMLLAYLLPQCNSF